MTAPWFALLQVLAILALLGFAAHQRASIQARLRRFEAAWRELSSAEQKLRLRLLELEGEIADLRDRPEPIVETATRPVWTPEPILSLNKRSQALRLLRKGETPERVAKAVGVPRSHIRLLVRVREMVEGREQI